MTLVIITVFIIILRRIISLVSIIIFNIIPGLFVMAFPGYYVGLPFGRGLSGGYKMRLAGRGIVDPVDAAISQRCFHSNKTINIRNLINEAKFDIFILTETWLWGDVSDSSKIKEMTLQTHANYHFP